MQSESAESSSRLIARSVAKAGFIRDVYRLSIEKIDGYLLKAHKDYYRLKKSHKEVRRSFLDEMVEALVLHENLSKANNLNQMRIREVQRLVARKI